MSTHQQSRTTLERTDSPSRLVSRPWALADLAFWALMYGLTAMVAADLVIRDVVADNLDDSPFASEAIFLTVLRVGSFCWALIFSLLQAVVYGYLFAAVTRAPRPPALQSWLWVLLSQIPFVALVAALFVVNGADGVGVVQEPWLRISLGLASVCIYAVMAARRPRVDMMRVSAFVVLALALNTALLMLTAVG